MLKIKEAGFSLVELMVSMTIGLFLVASVIQVFVGFSRGYSFQYNINTINDNIRFMMSEVFYHEIRMSGYPGCLTSKPIIHLDTASADYHPAKHGEISLWAWEYVGTGVNDTINLQEDPTPGGARDNWQNFISPGLPIELDGDVVPFTDVIVISSSTTTEIELADPLLETNRTVLTTNATNLPNDSILTIYNDNCGYAEVFQNGFDGTTSQIGMASGGTPGNVVAARFKESYSEDAQVLALQSVAYYIGQPDGEDRLSLMAKRIDIPGATAEEMIPDVENLQFIFGVTAGTDRRVDAYVTADQVLDWNQVSSVRIGVISQTPKGPEMTGQDRLALLGLTFNLPDDRRGRFESSITVARRNFGFE